jgi:NADH-quinone oxidoreductase subunit H
MLSQFIVLPFKTITYGIGAFLIVLYLMYFEQKIVSFIQMRKVNGSLGLRDILFPVALFINLFRVRLIFPETPYKFLYVLLPMFLAILVFIMGIFIPFHKSGLFWAADCGTLWVIVISHFILFFMMLIGWASQTQYSLQGVVRVFGHFIASALLLIIVSLLVGLWAGSLNFVHIIQEQKSMWFILPLFPVFVVHMIVLLMRGKCAPFGASESGVDLMGGYKSRYAGGLSVLLIVSEYFHFLLFSALTIVFFFGGWQPLWEVSYMSGCAWFFLKLIIFLVIISWIKAVLPNLRHDQLVRLSFKAIFPFIAVLFLIYSFIKILLGV